MNILYTRGTSSERSILIHLTRCNGNFIPPLNSRVILDEYARKIATSAERFEAWSVDSLIGLVAVYLGNRASSEAFITNVSVIPEWQGRGIASQLLERCVSSLRDLGVTEVGLEVNKNNLTAIELYRRLAFTICETQGNNFKMKYVIEEKDL